MPLLFADTSFYYAALDSRDPFHPLAKRYAEWLEENKGQLISTWEIVSETVTLLRTRYGYEGAMTFIRDVLPSLQIIYLSDRDRREALRLFEKLSSDKKLSLCDVVSYLVITKHLKRIPHLAFDDDFRSLGLTPFHLTNE